MAPRPVRNPARVEVRVDRAVLAESLGRREQRLKLIVEENVRLQLEHLHESPFVRTAMAADKLQTHGWVYDMDNGEIKVVKND